MTIQITQIEDPHRIVVQSPEHTINVQPSTYEVTIGSISGYGPKGDKGDKGDRGEDGAAASIDDVVGLQAALNAKANAVHYHVINDITDFDGTVFSGGTF